MYAVEAEYYHIEGLRAQTNSAWHMQVAWGILHSACPYSLRTVCTLVQVQVPDLLALNPGQKPNSDRS